MRTGGQAGKQRSGRAPATLSLENRPATARRRVWLRGGRNVRSCCHTGAGQQWRKKRFKKRSSLKIRPSSRSDRLDTIHHDAAVAVRNGRIAAVGPSREIVARFPSAERVDGAGKVVMPGFANIHTHFTLIIAKGIYEDLSPPHKPPFTSGLAPLPVPQLSNDEMNAMVTSGRPGGDPQRHHGGARRWQQCRELRADHCGHRVAALAVRKSLGQGEGQYR